MERIHHQSLIGALLLVGLIAFGSVSMAQDTRASADFIVPIGVHAVSTCNDVAVTLVYNTSQATYFSLLVQYQGETVTDNLSPLPISGLYALTSTGYENDRGLAPVNRWPLTPGKKVKIYMTLLDLNYEPIYEARATMQSCDSTTLKKTAHGPAHQLLRNSSFEVTGRNDAYAALPDTAAFWKGKNTVNDARVCNPVSRIRAGSSVYVGECGFLFNADGLTKSKLIQNYAGTVGDAGDIVVLQGFVQSFAGYGGGGKFTAVLKFADGTSNTLEAVFPVGQSLYNHPNGYPYFDSVVMPAPLVSAKVKIKQGFSTAQVAVDAVTLSVYTNSSTALRSIPIPPGAPQINLAAGR